MLTTMFYYDYYKPYILKGHAEKPAHARKDVFFANADDGKRDYVLNTARKTEVVDYMRGLSSGVTTLRETAKNLTDSIARYQNALRRRGGAGAEKEWLENSLSAFAKGFNSTYGFSTERPVSAELSAFAENIRQTFLSHESAAERMDGAFLSMDSRGALVFDAAQFENIGANALQKALAWIYPAAGEIKKQTVDFLTEPLAAHMTFKGLDYYYNYQYGGPHGDAFKLIDRGLLLDFVI